MEEEEEGRPVVADGESEGDVEGRRAVTTTTGWPPWPPPPLSPRDDDRDSHGSYYLPG